MKFRGVVFDLDGTLVDSRLDFAALAKRLELPVGAPILEAISLWPSEKRTAAMRVVHEFESEGAAASQPIAGAFAFFKYLKQARIPVALFTRNSREVMLATIRKHELEFSICLAREDAPPKPLPNGLLEIQRTWQIPHREILFIGDYLYDLQAGLAANIPTALYLPEPADFPTSGAFRTFKEYEELMDFV